MSDVTGEEPTWLDHTYLTKILQKYTENQLKGIISFTKAPATKKGENYASSMHLVTVKYNTTAEPGVLKEINLIVKSRLEEELFSQIEEDLNIFLREAQVYNRIMGAAEELLRSVNDETRFGPKAIFVDERIIVQEDLKIQGFSIQNVKTGLNFESCRLIVEKLAKFHAVTMVLYQKNPDLFRYHLPSNVSEHSSPLHDVYTNTIKNSIEYCQSNPQLVQYVPKLREFGEKIIPKVINVFSRSQMDRYHVLNHGDVWVNNMMFRKDVSGKVIEVLFVDYQEGFYGSPGIDWNFFIFSSWQMEVFQNHFEDLLTKYHSVLSELLYKLNYDQRIPTVDDVRKEIINKGFHGLITATCLLPILINEHADLADPLNFILKTDEANANRQKIFSNPKYGERLEIFLEYFVRNEIL
uniref:CHK kinase-like domain-containing protein n=1 Tax=Ceratitis capitata TaxID=7213 RepID=W8BND4_CERCA